MDSDCGQDLDAFVAELKAKQRRLLCALPDIDPQELFQILNSLLRPVGSGRRFFLRKRADGTYVF